ncbi:MAG TPA: hypothetical protein VNZ52_05485 [Candidatus Thermoplasmatota archaeon]|nr:hypothetical protein [Candidatus Thermoplasmatota archaeon]
MSEPHAPGAARSNGSAANGNGAASVAAPNPAAEKIERDCIKLIDAISELKRLDEKQTLRGIAELSGLSKDEVNRYLNPQVNELYNLDRLLVVRGRNRPLYNWLIVSGPPRKGDDGKWAGIMANTSKHTVFKAVAQRFGYEVKFIGDRGLIVDLEYRGIQNVALARMGKTWASQEPVVSLDEFR